MKRLAAAAAVVVLTLSACGGGGGRPSVSEIEDAITDSDNPAGEAFASLEDDQVTCVAEALEESELSDEALQALVDGDEDYEGSDEDEEALMNIATDEVTECVEEAAQ